MKKLSLRSFWVILLGFGLGGVSSIQSYAQHSGEDIKSAIDADFGVWDTRLITWRGRVYENAWKAVANPSLDGVDAAELTAISNPDITSLLSTSITGPTTLYFSYKSLEYPPLPLFGFFNVEVDNSSAGLGNPPWQPNWAEAEISIGPGEHEIKWTGGYVYGSDSKAYLDQVWTSNDPRPRIIGESAFELNHGASFNYLISTNKPCQAFEAQSLPPGLAININTGEITGTPSEYGLFATRVKATNQAGSHVKEIVFRVRTPKPGTEVPLEVALDTPAVQWSQVSKSEGSSSWVGVNTALGGDGLDAVICPVGAGTDNICNRLLARVTGPGTLSVKAKLFGLNSLHPPGFRIFHSINGTFSPTEIGNRELNYLITETTLTLQVPNGTHSYDFDCIKTTLEEALYEGFIVMDQGRFTPGVQTMSFDSWMKASGASSSGISYPPNVSFLDADNDGLNNLSEYALGGSPAQPDLQLLPQAYIEDNHLTMRLAKVPGVVGVSYVIQTNKTLAPAGWTSFGTEIVNEDETELIVRCTKTIQEQPSCHLRLKISLDNPFGN